MWTSLLFIVCFFIKINVPNTNLMQIYSIKGLMQINSIKKCMKMLSIKKLIQIISIRKALCIVLYRCIRHTFYLFHVPNYELYFYTLLVINYCTLEIFLSNFMNDSRGAVWFHCCFVWKWTTFWFVCITSTFKICTHKRFFWFKPWGKSITNLLSIGCIHSYTASDSPWGHHLCCAIVWPELQMCPKTQGWYNITVAVQVLCLISLAP